MEGSTEFEWGTLKQHPIPRKVRIEIGIFALSIASAILLALAVGIALMRHIPPIPLMVIVVTIGFGGVYLDLHFRLHPALRSAEADGWTTELNINAERAKRKLRTSSPIEVVKKRKIVCYITATASFLGLIPVGILLSGHPFVSFITVPLIIIACVSLFWGFFLGLEGDTWKARAWIEENGYKVAEAL